MRNYWTCSRFADWLRGTAKIKSGTGNQWVEWERSAKAKYPIRWWLAEEGLDQLQNIVYWIPDQINNIRYYVNNRWVTRCHALTAHPKDIRPGQWHDVGYRFLPCLFNELVDYVEIELAGHNCAWDPEARRQFDTPWWRRWYRQWRCPAAGVAHLKWASELTNKEWLDSDQKHLAEPTFQALAARETLALYRWWTEVYPNRPDPHDASGWTAYCDSRDRRGLGFMQDETDPSDDKIRKETLTRLREIEESYEAEDEAMMIRLIKIRKSLWT